MYDDYEECASCGGMANVKMLDRESEHKYKSACIEHLRDKIAELEKQNTALVARLEELKATTEMLNAVVGRMLDR